MADVQGSLYSWSATAASNKPADTDAVGTGLGANIRELQKVIRQDLANAATDLASASTCDIGGVASNYVNITGTTPITSFGTVSAGIWKFVKFAGALTLTHNSTSLILPGGTSILTVAGDTAIAVSEGSGNWRVLVYTSVGGGSSPAGAVMDYAGSSAPSGWLLCYGQAVSRTTYAGLYAAISTTYGTGDGSTTFNLPDCRGRVSAGKDDMGGTSANRLTNQSGGLNGDTLGATGGAETHTLVTSEIPAHTHEIRHATDGAGSSDYLSGGGSNNAGVNTGSTGGGGAHNNVQPTIIFNKIIKT